MISLDISSSFISLSVFFFFDTFQPFFFVFVSFRFFTCILNVYEQMLKENTTEETYCVVIFEAMLILDNQKQLSNLSL